MLKVTPDTYSSLDRFGLLGWLRIRGGGVVQSMETGESRDVADAPDGARSEPEQAAARPSSDRAAKSVSADPKSAGKNIS